MIGRSGPSREILAGCVLLGVIDAFYLRWVWLHFDLWGFWDWDYQQVLFEVARSTVLDHHQLPLWNPYLGGGVSLAGNTLNHVWAPCFAVILAFGTVAGTKLCIPIYLVIAQIGMWRLARERGLEEIGALLAAILFTVGGVFAHRLTHGHFEWIAIAWMPHVLVYVHRSVTTLTPRTVWLGGIAFAFVFLDGGPYQFAFFSLFAGAYACVVAIEARSARALWGLCAIAAIGAGFAAIKLLPVYEVVSRFPRETVPVNFYGAPFTPTSGEILFQMFLSRAQAHDPGQWMPYVLNVGCYVGVLPLLLAAVAVARAGRRNARWLGLAAVFLWIALGPASPVDAWSRLHELPFFSALRVPVRFNVYVLMLVALLAGDGLDQIVRWLRSSGKLADGASRPRWPEGLAAAIAILVAVDLAWVNGEVFRVAFSIPPIGVTRNPQITHHASSPWLKRYKESALFETHDNWPGAAFPAVLENRGVIKTYRTIRSRPAVIPFRARQYRGEVWMREEPREAIVAAQVSPNRLRAQTDGRAGVVIFNTNYAPGWEAVSPELPAPIPVHGRLAIALRSGTTHVTLRYRPPAFELGALSTVLTAGIGVAFAARASRRRRASG